MTTAAMPAGLAAYKRTPTFDQDTLPAGLRREHRTKAGVWALIHVVEGSLRYRILDPPSEEILTVGTPGLVRPEQAHEVAPIGQMRMYVEFYSDRTVQGGPHTSQVL
jgi:tellurite resistance-related uncharacterized protein